MSVTQYIQSNKSPNRTLIRAAAVALGMMALTVFAFASKGGGEKKKTSEFDSPFTPINSASTFTLRKAPNVYNGSMGSYHSITETHVSLSPLITTYQKGNTTVILPFQYQSQMGRMSGDGVKSSLQLFGVKIQIPR